MTTGEMITLFNQRYRKSSPINDDMDDDQIVLLLNAAITKITKEIYDDYVSGNIAAIEDLISLQKSGSIFKTGSIASIPNASVYFYPDDYRYFLSGLVNVTTYESIAVDYWIDCERISITDIGRYLRSNINLPIIDVPKFIEYDNKMVVMHEGSPEMDTGNLLLHYIKIPEGLHSGSLLSSSDLPKQLHEKVVEEALLLTVESDVPDEQRVQTVKMLDNDN